MRSTIQNQSPPCIQTFQTREILREIDILKTVVNENVVTYLTYYTLPHGSATPDS